MTLDLDGRVGIRSLNLATKDAFIQPAMFQTINRRSPMLPPRANSNGHILGLHASKDGLAKKGRNVGLSSMSVGQSWSIVRRHSSQFLDIAVDRIPPR